MTSSSSTSWLLAALLLAAVALGACGDRGDDALDELLVHTEQVVSILEAHAGDPNEALERVDAYQVEHQAEVARLLETVRKLRHELSSGRKRELYARLEAALRPLTERIEALERR